MTMDPMVFFCERFIVWQIQPSPEETGEALVLTDVPAIRSGGFQSASDAKRPQDRFVGPTVDGQNHAPVGR